MRLDSHELRVFYKLHQALLFFVNQRLKIIEEPLADPQEFARQHPDQRIKVRDALRGHMDLIDAFVSENPAGLTEDEREIVRSWKHLVAGRFYIFRYLKQHTIFLSTSEPAVAYGVLPLADSFKDLVGPELPRLVETVLLPFQGRIVYDGHLMNYNMTFGPGIRRSLKESYDNAKALQGVITSLPTPADKPRPARTQATLKSRTTGTRKAPASPSVPHRGHPAHDQVVALTDAFCREHLDDEYGALCRKLTGVLARKRPSPLTRGKPESWACGIVRVVGWVNFLGDPSQPHHMKMTDIDQGFGVSEATGSAKSMAIRNLLKLQRLEPEWTLSSRMDDNPIAWMIQVNGLIVDARSLPREIQEAAFRQGVIPYIPGDRSGDSD